MRSDDRLNIVRRIRRIDRPTVAADAGTRNVYGSAYGFNSYLEDGYVAWGGVGQFHRSARSDFSWGEGTVSEGYPGASLAKLPPGFRPAQVTTFISKNDAQHVFYPDGLYSTDTIDGNTLGGGTNVGGDVLFAAGGGEMEVAHFWAADHGPSRPDGKLTYVIDPFSEAESFRPPWQWWRFNFAGDWLTESYDPYPDNTVAKETQVDPDNDWTMLADWEGAQSGSEHAAEVVCSAGYGTFQGGTVATYVVELHYDDVLQSTLNFSPGRAPSFEYRAYTFPDPIIAHDALTPQLGVRVRLKKYGASSLNSSAFVLLVNVRTFRWS